VSWVLLAAAVVIVVGIVVVAIGRGGELASAPADTRPLTTQIVTAADVALLRPPAALWGYDMRATDEALNMVARTVTERDVEIATLRRQLADMQPGTARTRDGEPDRAGDPGITAPGFRPPAVPLHRGADGPARLSVDTQQWSAWARPGPAAPPEEDGEHPEVGPGNSAPGNSGPGTSAPGTSGPGTSAPGTSA